jgi:predicted negative regulator of RcsB-dependent stress response
MKGLITLVILAFVAVVGWKIYQTFTPEEKAKVGEITDKVIDKSKKGFDKAAEKAAEVGSKAAKEALKNKPEPAPGQ